MIIFWTLGLVLVAGFINGSFATPAKYMHRWKEENVWFVFSFWGFLILPWVSILFMAPKVFDVLDVLPPDIMWAMIAGGAAFGLGQIAFATSFRYIGIGLAFVINISMGTAGSALIPILWHKGVMGTTYSYLQLTGVVFFVTAVILGALAATARDRHRKELGEMALADEAGGPRRITPGRAALGVLLAVLAGVGSMAQGVTYIWVNPTVSKLATGQFGVASLAGSTIAWVIIFSIAWIPYMLYFLLKNLQKGSFAHLLAPKTCGYWLLTVLMGIGFWGSLIFFSGASNVIGGDLAPTIAWPMFMVFIILTSNFWGWKSGEWHHAGGKASTRLLVSLALFVVAIVVFSYSSKFEPTNPATPEDHHHDVHYKHIQHDRYPTYQSEHGHQK